MAFLERFKEIMLGQIPLTSLLSLRSICFRLVFLLLSNIKLSAWISMLLSYKVCKVWLLWINSINLSYLVSWFLSFSSGEERQIFSITEFFSLTNNSSRTSFPSLQLHKESSLKVSILTNFIGFI